jgi:hypothetical protein
MNSLKNINRIRFTKNALAIALLAGLSLVGFEKTIAAGSPDSVTIILENYLTSATGSEGPFTATGDLNTSGFNTMVVRGTKSNTLHCSTVLTDDQGSITLDLQCRMILTSETTAGGPGHWMVVSGTGAYANLHGAGSLTMDIDFVTGAAVETLQGFVFFDNRP